MRKIGPYMHPRRQHLGKSFIIHPCDPTVVICFLIWPCDIAVRITYLISHSSSLSYDTVIKDISGWMYNKYKTTLVC